MGPAARADIRSGETYIEQMASQRSRGHTVPAAGNAGTDHR